MSDAALTRPKSQLSYDIWVYIFSLVGPKTYSPNTFVDVHDDFIKLPPSTHSFAFSQVCQQWRSTALSIPSLWSTPLFNDSRLGALMLDRASKTPLTIIWPSMGAPLRRDHNVNPLPSRASTQQGTAFIAILKDRVEQVAGLDLVSQEPAFDLDVMCRHVLSHSKMLTKVRIRYVPIAIESTSQYASPCIMDYRDLELPLGIAAITYLSMRDCFIMLPRTRIQHIQTLIIDFFWTTVRVSLDDLMDLLQGTPALVSLNLVWAIGNSLDSSSHRKPAELTSLRSLEIRDSPLASANLLAYLQMPYVHSYTISLMNLPDDASSPNDIMNHMETLMHYTVEVAQAYPRLAVVQAADGNPATTTISAGPMPDVEGSLLVTDMFEVSAALEDDHFLGIVFGFIPRFGNWSSLRSFEIQLWDPKLENGGDEYEEYTTGFPRVEVHDGGIPTHEQCVRLLSAMPALEMLTLNGDTSGRVFLASLTRTDGKIHNTQEGFAEKAPNNTPLLCLGLKTLRLYKLSLAMEREDMPDDVNGIIEALGLFLRLRKTHGVPIRQLQAIQAQLNGEHEEEVDDWQNHFLQWVDQVELDDGTALNWWMT
jgi:hypothetical protein